MLFLLALGCPAVGPSTGTPTGDTATAHPTKSTEPVEIRGVTWRLHADFGTLAYLSWEQTGTRQIHVDYRFEGKDWLHTPRTRRSDGAHEQLLLGIPYEQTLTWRIMAGDEVLAEGTDLRTGDAPRQLPRATLELADPERWYDEGRYLLTSVNESTGGWTGGPFWTVILDRAGRAVWARRTTQRRWTLFAQVSTAQPDHLLIDEDSVWSSFDEGKGSEVLRTYLDAPIASVPTPGLQHAFVELSDGTLAWGSMLHRDVESLVELAPGAEEATALWSCHDWPGAGNCESNGLFYDAVTNTYLYSFWTNHTVLAVDRATGANVWWAGALGGGYDFVPSGSDFWLQHGVSYTADRTLLLSSEEDGPTTEVREFAIDHDARTLTEVWHFDAEAHAVTNGDAWRLPGGNTLHVVGSAGVIKEAAPDGTVVWHVDYHAERLLGRGELIRDLYALAAP